MTRRRPRPDVAAANARVTKTDRAWPTPSRAWRTGSPRSSQERNDLAKQVEAAKGETQAGDRASGTRCSSRRTSEIAAVTKEMQDRLAQLASFQTADREARSTQIQTSSNTTLTQAQQQNEQLTAQLNQAHRHHQGEATTRSSALQRPARRHPRQPERGHRSRSPTARSSACRATTSRSSTSASATRSCRA